MNAAESLTAMAIRHVSSAAILVTLSTDLKEATSMTSDQFEREKNYRVYVCIAKSMLKEGVIDEREYSRINGFLVKRYSPVIGQL